jgi:copper chaperone
MDNSFQVDGMTCGHCEQTVKKAIARLDPAAKVEIDLNTGKVNVHSALPRDDIALAIANEGYAVA